MNISGFPGGGAGWSAWPEGEGVEDDAPASLAERETAEDGGNGQKVGSRRGQLADSGVTTGPVGT